jgi:CRP-like cAMP-binding protein
MRRRFEAGEALFRQGDPSDVALQILSGSVDVLREVGDDAIVLGTVRAGEFVGEMGVLEGRTRSATVRAAGPVEA